MKRPDPRRWIRGPADELAVREGCWFDERAAARVVEFFHRFLRHSKGQWAGKPFDLLDWQREDVIYPIFGWKTAAGIRRFRMAYVEIPKKNGKSTLAAGITLFLLVADGEPGAEVYTVAKDRGQAKIVFQEAQNMVEQSPDLASVLRVKAANGRIVFGRTRSWLQCLSADVPSKDGINASGLVFDELHTQQTRELWDKLRYAGASRRQPLLVSITTAGDDRRSICYEQRTYAEKVRDGVVPDITFFPYIRAAADDDDWSSPETWKKANPSLGDTISIDSFRADFLEAAASPAKESAFRRYRLNQWTTKEARWLSTAAWAKCAPPAGWKKDDLEGCECFGGLDLSSTSDLTALVLSFRRHQRYHLLSWFWCPEERVEERRRSAGVEYPLWIKQGFITPTPGPVVDYKYIRQTIVGIRSHYHLKTLAVDRWNATQLVIELRDEDGLDVEFFGQGFASLQAPTKEFDVLVNSGVINHADNPVLAWMAANVAVEIDAAGNMKPSKVKSSEKVDGIVAAVMSIGLWQREPESEWDGSVRTL